MSTKKQVVAVGGDGGWGDLMPSKFSMIHAAADLFLIIGITMWLNGKINAISVQNKDAELAELKKQNEILHQRLQRVEQILQQLLPPPPQEEEPPKETKKKKKKSSPTQSEESESEEVEEIPLE